MKKILFINGSPRHAENTRLLLQELKNEFNKTGHETDFCDLYHSPINASLNLNSCKRNQEKYFMNDVTHELLDKIEEADTIIWGSPVYWWGITEKIKLLIDKFYARDGYSKTLKKEIGLIVVGSNDLLDKQYHLIKEQFSCIADYLGWTLKFYLPLSAYEAGKIMKDNQIIQTVHEIAEKFSIVISEY